MKKTIVSLCLMFFCSANAATVEEIHEETFQEKQLVTYRGICSSAGSEEFIVQWEDLGYRYHGPAGYGVTGNARVAVQAACAEEQVSGLEG